MFYLCLGRASLRGTQVGTRAALEEKGSISREWQRATAEEKAEYQRQANSMQAAREEVLSQSLSKAELDEHAGLRKSQIMRLHQPRLGQSIQELARHPVWDSGLKVAGHNSPLKEEHVLLDLSEEDLQQKHKLIFGFDPAVMPNPQPMPTFHRSCQSFCAGLCRCNENFETVVDFIRLFEQSLQARKLSGQPMVLSLQPVHGVQQWVFLGCVCKRPMLQHFVVQLWARNSEQLSITVKDGAPQICTMHQVLDTQIRKHVGAGRPRDTFRVEVRQHWFHFFKRSAKLQFCVQWCVFVAAGAVKSLLNGDSTHYRKWNRNRSPESPHAG